MQLHLSSERIFFIIFGAHLLARQPPACSNCQHCNCQHHGQQSTIKINNQQSTCVWEKGMNKRGWGGRGKRNIQQQAICVCGANATPNPNTMPPMTLPTINGIEKGRRSVWENIFQHFWFTFTSMTNAKYNNQPGAKTKPMKRAWGWEMIKINNTKQPTMQG